MPERVEINPELLVWARQRSGLSFDDLARRFPGLAEWERGNQQPTLKQLESFAHATHTAVGFLFLPQPPEEPVPIPDYRTVADRGVRRPSADLLDTIYQCEDRQAWYRDFAILNGEPPVAVVGSLSTSTTPPDAADTMRAALRFGIDDRGATWTAALRVLVDNAEKLGFLVMVSSVVGSNTHRKLDPGEFRGFTLADQYAPLIFINGADTKAAQIFTLLHELAHQWLGDTALDDASLTDTSPGEIERWCNQVAAEILIPLSAVHDRLLPDKQLDATLERFARQFKVSTLVVLRRLYDARRLSWKAYQAAYGEEFERIMELLSQQTAAGGGNFFNTQPVRVGKRFARAVVTSTLEGQTLYRDAVQLLGIKKVSTFHEFASHLGIG